MYKLELCGENLSLLQLKRFLSGPSKVAATADAIARVRRCADFCGELALGEKLLYGINTGFGRFASHRVERTDAGKLQENLLRSHAVGMGPDLPEHIVRLMMVLRVNSLLRGFSGVSVELVELLMALINNGITPVVPTYGSVGASGDLAPLAHMALPLIGESDVDRGGKRQPALAALQSAGLKPIRLGPKEGLALINGTQLMSAFAAYDLLRLDQYTRASMCAAAMALEAYEATASVFDARILKLKNQPGCERVAAGFRLLTADSEIVASHTGCTRVQDPYSFRCLPQVLGAVVDTMAWTSDWVTREVNAVTDNPLVFPDDGDVISGGNFHGEHMAMALDAIAIAAAEVAGISERRIDKLIDNDSEKLPRCLIKDPGLNSGLMITQYLAAALVSENKIYAHPASVDSIPTSMGFEDHVSMGSIAALKATKIIDNVARVVAVELLCAAQAIDFHKPLKPGSGSRVAHEWVRARVPFFEHDQIVSGHLKALEQGVISGELTAAVEGQIGDILLPVQG